MGKINLFNLDAQDVLLNRNNMISDDVIQEESGVLDEDFDIEVIGEQLEEDNRITEENLKQLSKILLESEKKQEESEDEDSMERMVNLLYSSIDLDKISKLNEVMESIIVKIDKVGKENIIENLLNNIIGLDKTGQVVNMILDQSLNIFNQVDSMLDKNIISD